VLNEENREAILERATHRTKRQIEELVAELSPRPDVPFVMRKLSQPMAGRTPSTARGDAGGPVSGELVPGRVGPSCPSVTPRPPLAPSQRVEPLSPGRYKIQLTASAALCDKLERLRALMRSEVPSGDLAQILERAVTEKLERLEARRFARTAAPRKKLTNTSTTPTTRHIPAAVRRAVHERDASRCRFVDSQGRRCSERRQLEFHHRHPFGMGGDHSAENISLLCSTHNRRLAEHDYGEAAHVRRRPAGRTD
jgi:hypothetical protein